MPRPLVLLSLFIAFIGTPISSGLLIYKYYDSFQYKSNPNKLGRGILFHDRLRVSDGYNLFIVFRRWKTRYCEIQDLNGKFITELTGEYCLLLDDGSYVTSDHGLAKFDRSNQLKWRQEGIEVHHDINYDSDTGDIFAWARKQNVNVRGKKIRSDELLGFSKDGHPIFLWKAIDHLQDLDQLYGLKVMPIVTIDHFTELTHFNSVQVIPQNSLAHSAFKKGNLLVSCARCACMAIIDRKTGHFAWSYHAKAAALNQIHTARLLPNGNILFFHNIAPHKVQGEKRERDSSEVIEIDPLSKKTIWSYRSSTPGVFSAPYMGSALRLDNGNTLVTHLANGGGAFEVTKEGRIVWDWSNSAENPIFEGEIYKVMRVPKKIVDQIVFKKTQKPRFF